ncbi:hypothetical protein [Luteibacter aegosomatissinici]|uniref:hypothetical protein n=1 Tax=Luteibacter aegosomatissinici TaxID=2911539 RepID=UPI001FFB08D6|nr:hypothetical protein [Luteibacter aegosomatissinici]UPG94039.1 hypothetical protein L2Y97_19800 [Luteibacter aegosomatissinici]
MTLFRKSLTAELGGRAQRLAGALTHDHTRELAGAARQYVGRAGIKASQAGAQAAKAASRTTKQVSSAALIAGKQVRNHPRTSIAIGAGLGVAALTAAWLLRRHDQKQRASLEHDEHDPTRYRTTNAAGDALDGSGEDNPVPGETGLY